MKIEIKKLTVKELVNGYQDNAENGVVSYGGKLDIRPPFQREFIYNEKQREAVIETVTKDFPLNVMYWAIRKDDTFEIIDGQQRTISICQYVKGEFSYQKLYFHNLQDDQKSHILNYKLMIYVCSGNDSEKLEWFKIINIAGIKLSDQELRNAVYAGSWLSHAKRHFSKTRCVAYGLGSDYLKGSAIRQEYLETTLKWISNDNIEDYMSKHQHEPNANELWLYFQRVIAWVEVVFTKYRKEMKGLPWGEFYNKHKDGKFDANKLEKEIKKLMEDEDVSNKKGIYAYLLDGQERYLNIRAFSPNQKREAYEKQKGICPKCGEYFQINKMEADHIIPWHKGGKTELENCQMLCEKDNREKAGK